MRNTKEIKTILSVLFYLNRLGADDKDIENLIDYAFDRIFGCNTTMLSLACIGFTKDEAMPEIDKILKLDTEYHRFIEKKDTSD